MKKEIINLITLIDKEYAKLQKEITVDNLIEAQDTSKEDLKEKYKIGPLKKKRLEVEIDSELFRYLLPAGDKRIVSGREYIESNEKIYSSILARHNKLFIISLKAKTYCAEYLVTIRHKLYPQNKEMRRLEEKLQKIL